MKISFSEKKVSHPFFYELVGRKLKVRESSNVREIHQKKIIDFFLPKMVHI